MRGWFETQEVAPRIYIMRYGAHFPWLEDQSVMTHACPDYKNPVVFELGRVKSS